MRFCSAPGFGACATACAAQAKITIRTTGSILFIVVGSFQELWVTCVTSFPAAFYCQLNCKSSERLHTNVYLFSKRKRHSLQNELAALLLLSLIQANQRIPG